MPYRPIVMFHLFRHVLWSNVPSAVPSVPSCFRETEWNSLPEACVNADTITAFQTQLHYAP